MFFGKSYLIQCVCTTGFSKIKWRKKKKLSGAVLFLVLFSLVLKYISSLRKSALPVVISSSAADLFSACVWEHVDFSWGGIQGQKACSVWTMFCYHGIQMSDQNCVSKVTYRASEIVDAAFLFYFSCTVMQLNPFWKLLFGHFYTYISVYLEQAKRRKYNDYRLVLV